MTTLEEFEMLHHDLVTCIANISCGVNLSEVDSMLFATIRRRCDELSSMLVELV